MRWVHSYCRANRGEESIRSLENVRQSCSVLFRPSSPIFRLSCTKYSTISSWYLHNSQFNSATCQRRTEKDTSLERVKLRLKIKLKSQPSSISLFSLREFNLKEDFVSSSTPSYLDLRSSFLHNLDVIS